MGRWQSKRHLYEIQRGRYWLAEARAGKEERQTWWKNERRTRKLETRKTILWATMEQCVCKAGREKGVKKWLEHFEKKNSCGRGPINMSPGWVSYAQLFLPFYWS